MSEVLMVVAVAAPLVAHVPAPGVARRWAGRRTQAGALVAAAIWLGLLMAGAEPSLGRLAPDELALAGCAGVALVALVVAPVSGYATAGALASLSAALVVTTDGRPSLPILAIGLAGAAALICGGRHSPHPAAAAVAAVAVAPVALGVAVTSDVAAAVLVAAGAALLAVVVGLWPVDPAAVLLPAALVAAARVVPAAAGDGALDALAIMLGLAAAGLAATALWRTEPTAGATATVVALWSLVAATGPVPGTRPAALLLAVAAVVAAALPARVAALAALPGSALLVRMLADEHQARALLLAGLLVVTAAAVAGAGGGGRTLFGPQPSSAPPPGAGTTPAPALVDRLAVLPAALVGLWLLVAPGTWAWVGGGELGPWDDGAAIAAAAALVAGTALCAATRSLPALGLASVQAAARPADRADGDAPVGRWRAGPEAAATVSALVVLGVAVAALVASTTF